MALPPLLIGKRIRLTAVRHEDTSIMTRWYEDAEFARMLDAKPAYPRTESKVSRFLHEESGKDSEEERLSRSPVAGKASHVAEYADQSLAFIG